MASNFLDIFIKQYLTDPNSAFGKSEYRGLLHSAIPPVGKQTANQIIQNMPHAPIVATFIPALRAIGMHAMKTSPANTLKWAQLTTALLGRIIPTDQDDTMRRYGHIRSEVINPDKIMAGLIYTYRYKAEADIYDEFPMTLVLDRDDKTFLGMNFHYLPYTYRFALFQALMPLIAPLPVSLLSSINITYQALASSNAFKGYKPTIKRYRLDRMQSNALFISPIEWGVAMAFPSHSFIGDSYQSVWRDGVNSV